MPPKKKLQLAKSAWAWSDTVDLDNITDEHIKTAYRLDIPKCVPFSCRRNCRNNPYCLSSLGESKWLNETTEESDDDDPMLDLRKPKMFVGLKNLGATCYVNSLLQLWFHMPEFREAVLLWDPKEDVSEKVPPADGANGETPRSVVGHLQLLFILMQYGLKKTLDPKEFIRALSLEPCIQQDAQEFSKLFFSLLEESFRQQTNPSVKNFITEHFCGEYSYITRCSKCLKESVSPSLFYELELNVKGNKSLHESLREFLKEEKMEGVNAYSCSSCMGKQEATRFIRLERLPNVLNLQLMRFIYDRQKGQKKKLNSFIQFPESLDMTEYVSGASEVPLLYNLNAVLVHKGPSAYSGHYIAHVRDRSSGTWFKFNDETVEKMEGKKLKLNGGEEEEDGAKKVKKPAPAKGHLSSSNAYMLVYTRASSESSVDTFTEDELPELLKTDLKKHKDEIEFQLEQYKQQQNLLKAEGQAQKKEISSLLAGLPVTEENMEWEALSSFWLSHWLANAKGSVKPIDNSKLLCQHNKLHPDLSKDAKYVNTYAAESLYEKYKGGPRLLGSEALCKECVTSKAKEIQMRHKIAEDAKTISTLLKQPLNENEPAFWVGKHSLKAWRRMASDLYLGKDDDKVVTNGNDGDDSDNEAPVNGSSCRNGKDSELIEHDDDSKDRRCGSGDSETATSPAPNDKFVDSPFRPASSVDFTAFDPNDPECRLSLAFALNLIADLAKVEWFETLCTDSFPPEHVNDFKKLYASFQTVSKALDFFHEKYVVKCCRSLSHPVNTSPIHKPDETSLSARTHLKRKRSPSPKENGDASENPKIFEGDIEEEFNEEIVCSHGCLILQESSRRLVPQQVWSLLKHYFPRCKELPNDSEPCPTCKSLASAGEVAKDQYKQAAQIQRELLSTLLSNRGRPKFVGGTFHVVSVSEFLNPWKKFIKESGREPPLYSLRNSTLVCVHDRLMMDLSNEKDLSLLAPVTDDEWSILSSVFKVDNEITCTFNAHGEIISTTPAVCQDCLGVRIENEQLALFNYTKASIYVRQVLNHKLSALPADENDPPSPEVKFKQADVSSAVDNIRRSTRHRRVPGEKTISISSTDTLRDLKLKILEIFHVSPFDQHLVREDGIELTELDATLPTLNIFPNSIVILKVDEPIDGESSAPVDDYKQSSLLEKGFTGTALLKR